jgi:hypothetical protein
MTLYLDANCVIYLVELNLIWGPDFALRRCTQITVEILS